jgi:hypothetical protein
MTDGPPSPVSSRRSSTSISPQGEAKAINGSRVLPEKQQVAPNGDDGVEYQHLTFETEIPPLTPITLPDGVVQSPPNLKQYQSPFHWSPARKNIALFISCTVTLLAAYSAGSYSIAATPLSEKWGLSNVAFNLGVTLWATGFALSPMVLAPLSEINGRRPVFIGSGVLFREDPQEHTSLVFLLHVCLGCMTAVPCLIEYQNVCKSRVWL